MSNNFDSEIEKSGIGSQASGVALAPRVVLAQIVNGIQIFLSLTLFRRGKTDSSRSCKGRPLRRKMCTPRSCNGRIPDMETMYKAEECNKEPAWEGSCSNNGPAVGKIPRRISAANERRLACSHDNPPALRAAEVGEPNRPGHPRGRPMPLASPARFPLSWQRIIFPTPRRSQFSWRLLIIFQPPDIISPM